MYGTAHKRDNSSRIVGVVAVGAAFGLVALGLAFGVGTRIVAKLTETEVVIIEEAPVEDEEPPPPPPVDVELPPPPPQVVLPEFTFDVPPPPNAIQQVEQVQRPVAPPPAPRPAVTITSRPEVGRRATMPEYPAAARRAQEEGTTTLEMCIDERGRVTDIKIVGSSGSSRLDDAALRHWQRNRFTPAKKSDGTDASVCGHILENVWSLEDAR